MKLPPKLPSPNEYGNFYFGGKGKAPAILRGGVPFDSKDNGPSLIRGRGEAMERWFISTEAGVLFDGADICYFESAQEAFDALRGEE